MHTVAAILGVVTALIVCLAIAVQYGYLASSTVAALTPTGLAFIAILSFIAAVGAYAVEDRH